MPQHAETTTDSTFAAYGVDFSTILTTIVYTCNEWLVFSSSDPLIKYDAPS